VPIHYEGKREGVGPLGPGNRDFLGPKKSRANERGLALEIETFLGPEMATSEASAI
jgi:hypothetical protein